MMRRIAFGFRRFRLEKRQYPVSSCSIVPTELDCFSEPDMSFVPHALNARAQIGDDTQ